MEVSFVWRHSSLLEREAPLNCLVKVRLKPHGGR